MSAAPYHDTEQCHECGEPYWICRMGTCPGDLIVDEQDCGCAVSHPRWCAWNGPCCDACSHGADEAHAECCRVSTTPESTGGGS